MERLLEILSWRRSYMTQSEHTFIQKYIASIPGIENDEEGNYWLRVGESETMFSCHTDTVHHSDGKQKILYFSDIDTVAKTTLQHDPDYDGECLGADDGAGIWLMLNMIECEVPGLYVFHRGEEMGGIGSSHIVSENPELVDGIKRCIAFDRRGTRDIITHQGGSRCCSDAFAWALSDALVSINKENDLIPCNKGVFTDSANYTHLIPECTNLSVGYDMEHTINETLDTEFIVRLLYTCIEMDWEALPTERKAEPEAEFDWGWNRTKPKSRSTTPKRHYEVPSDYDVTFADALDICRNSPEVVAELLLELGVTYGDIESIHDDLYGFSSKYRYSGI